MKKLLLLLFIVLVLALNAAGILLLLPGSPFHVKKQTVYIALAGPMSGYDKENGEAMLRGCRMYLDSIRDSGRFKDKKIELLIYNDKDKRTAISIASQIADEAKALLVIGHYDSDNSVAAGTIYRKNGIPAITASATSEAITEDNDWYFRVVPDNRALKNFIAYGVKHLLNSKSASIIYDKNDYGTSLAEGFEAKTEALEISICNKWAFDSESENMDHELNNIIGELRAVENTGTIFCATYSAEGVRFFASCRYPGTDYSVVGPDKFSSPAFISQFSNYPREQASPGYYTNGIRAVSPFISYLADEENARVFRQRFMCKYGKEPSWLEACYYDAMDVALRAIERAEVQGQDIREDRRRFRKALASFDEHDVAIRGITGDIYFDKQGNVTRPLAMGFWNRHIFLPTFLQFQPVRPVPASDEKKESNGEDTEDHKTDDTEKKAASGEILMIEGQPVTYLHIVYTGVDINKIHNINVKKGTFTADFYIWFRFSGKFDDTRIRFTNARNPVHLGEPVLKARSGPATIRTYRVIADFKTDMDTKAYPLDQQSLRISFRHEARTRKEMLFVPDVAGLPQTVGEKDKGKTMAKATSRWKTEDISYVQDIAKITGPDEQTRFYSRFNTDILVQREGRTFLSLKYGIPMLAAVIILYFIFLVPADMLYHRVIIFIPVLLTILGIRFLYGYLLPGLGIFRNIFPVIYLLAGFSAMLSVLASVMHRQNATEKAKMLNQLGKITYLVLALAGGGFFTYLYWTLFFPE